MHCNRLLYIGALSKYGDSSTCYHRLLALNSIGCIVDSIDTELYFHWNSSNKIRNYLFNKGFDTFLSGTKELENAVRTQLLKNEYNIIWIDKGIFFSKSFLKRIKESYPSIKIIGYSPDDMGQRHNQSAQFLSSITEYDLFITTKSYNVPEIKAMGCKEVYFINNAFEDTFHYPRVLDKTEFEYYHADVGFIGAYEKERGESIYYLANNFVPVRVFCNRWPLVHPNIKVLPAIFNENYCKAISATKINLAFLRKINRDQQTTRSIEIPACGGFMLAERTEEHLQLFKEGVEADFFNSNEEMLDKCRYYLKHDDERQKIAKRGLAKCHEAGYSNKDRLKKVLEYINTKE